MTATTIRRASGPLILGLGIMASAAQVAAKDHEDIDAAFKRVLLHLAECGLFASDLPAEELLRQAWDEATWEQVEEIIQLALEIAPELEGMPLGEAWDLTFPCPLAAAAYQQFLGGAVGLESRDACICRTHQSLRPRANHQCFGRRVCRHERVRGDGHLAHRKIKPFQLNF